VLFVAGHGGESVQKLQEISIKILKAFDQKVYDDFVCVIENLLAPLTLRKILIFGKFQLI